MVEDRRGRLEENEDATGEDQQEKNKTSEEFVNKIIYKFRVYYSSFNEPLQTTLMSVINISNLLKH